MVSIIRSELTRLGQPRLLITWFGLMALFAVLADTVMISLVASGTSLPPAGPGVVFPTLAQLERPAGLMAGLAAASELFGVVTLAFWAVATATDYSTGLIRLLVAAEPRRWRLLAGKVGALVVLTAAATTVATLVNILAAPPAAGAVGVAIDAWATDPLGVIARGWVELFLALTVWGVLGMVIAVLTRSAAVAIAVGIADVLVVEMLLKMVHGAPSEWLLGSTLNAVASGGTASMGLGTALVLAAAYVTIGLLVAGVVFARRDVTD